MADNFDLEQRLELRDPAGRTLGFFVPENTLRDLLAEQQRMRKEVAQLRQSQQDLEKERERYRLSLRALAEQNRAAMEKDIEEMKRNGIPFELLIEEVDQVIAAHSGKPQKGN